MFLQLNKLWKQIKMKNIRLIDVPAGKVYNLTTLVENIIKNSVENMDVEDVEIFVGRAGEGCLIELGKGISFETGDRKTKEQKIGMLEAIQAVSTVSRHHATIRYGWKEMGEGFYIKDNSKNRTTIDGDLLSFGERGYLSHGAELFFGNYGPVEISESSDQ